MSQSYKKIELTANVLIIALVLLVAGIFAQKYFFSRVATPPLPKAPAIGDKVLLEGFDWSKSDKTLLLVLQKGCRYCTESAPFYQNLIQQTKGKPVRLVAVLPNNREEAEQYMAELNISGIDIRQASLNSLNVGGTPTLLLADHEGKVTDVWLGKLKPDKQHEALIKLTN